ncbi:MAG: CAP domain-containing protein [Thaumarchaeota archaeon]|nr:CAP domain-containing protein [Nitrososphaerota archaeon]
MKGASAAVILALLFGLATVLWLDSLDGISFFETKTETATTTAPVTESRTLTETLVSTTTRTQTVTSTATQTGSQVRVIIQGDVVADISYPHDYDELAEYALSLINEDRGIEGLAPVTLSPIPSGQYHANSMLRNGYFSHWDDQGYKPYMRYTLLGGRGSVTENVGVFSCTPACYLSTSDVKEAIKALQSQMMHNDTICCNDGHRNNILNPHRNRVSIGVAYLQTAVYLVQDFENYYMHLFDPVYSDGIVTLRGSLFNPVSPTTVAIYFDKSPTPISPSLLNEPLYAGAYDQGDFTGGVFPPCTIRCPSYAGTAITVYATTWQVSSDSMNIQFPLVRFIQKHGNGVYTLQLLDTDMKPPQESTSISIFIG